LPNPLPPPPGPKHPVKLKAVSITSETRRNLFIVQ
jgi:hypothetical protein